MDLGFVFIQPVYVFWLGHLVHLHLSNYWYVCPYCHFINCFGFVFIALFHFLLFFSPLEVGWLSLVLYLSWFLIFVCVSVVEFCFTVTLKFWYGILYIYEIFLSCWFLNCKCICSVLICTFLFSWCLISVTYLCVDDFLNFLCICLCWQALSFLVFLFLVMAFFFCLEKFLYYLL